MKYDIVLKDLLYDMPGSFIYVISGMKAVELLNVELPEVRKRNPDLLLLLDDDSILHIELQAYNDVRMAERMLEYKLLIKQRYKDKEVRQVVVYVGDDKMQMSDSIECEGLSYRFRLMDIREVDCEDMVRSDYISDIIIGSLCRVRDEDRYVERLLRAIRNLSEEEKKDTIKKALTLLRLRPILYSKVEKKVKEESMPLTIVEIEKDPYYKKGIRRGAKAGLKRGIKRGIERGRREGIELGMERGIERGKIETARRMYEEGIRDIVFISRITGIGVERLREILRV
jgi:predicted transposase/invertase (TIGR01784 family)